MVGYLFIRVLYLATALVFAAPLQAAECPTVYRALSAKQRELSRIARKEGLHYIASTGEGGFTRKGRAGSFRYFNSSGKRVTDPKALEKLKRRLDELQIPPSYEETWVSSDPLAHLQATAVSSSGETHYYYHPRWLEVREQVKFERMGRFVDELPKIRSNLRLTLDTAEADSKERSMAAALRLLDLSGIRVGNEESALARKTYGLTTLKPSHLTVRGKQVELEFTGKAGVDQNPVIVDEALANFFKERSSKRGPKTAFAYRDSATGEWKDLSANDINDAIKDLSQAEDLSAKDFRTLRASRLAARLLYEQSAVPEKEREQAIAEVVVKVSQALGNTPAVAKKSYIDPRILDLYTKGKLKALFDRAQRKAESLDGVATEEIFLSLL